MSRSLKPQILIAEDEEAISAVLKYNLKKQGYNVVDLADGEEAFEFAKVNKPDLVILDWLLPSMSGVDVCKALRSHCDTENIPIIMLTAKSSESDKINALERGADDYITKPFSPAELIARIKALLRRIRPAFSGKMLAFEDIKMELLSHTVTRQGIELELSPIEFNILLVLMENPGRVLSRETLMSKVWGNDIYVGSRTIDVHITRLRKTLMNASKDGQDIIKTVRLEGYTLRIPSKKAA
jgi:two-component system phosphate regulon response regulator PhoB